MLAAARSCTLCAAHLPQGPRPVLRAGAGARLLIIGQAPGLRAHASGIPWNDPSGDRLRAWLALERERFYDADRVAIVPMGFCYPGRDPKGGDRPPCPECAPTWHPRLLKHLTSLSLTLMIGRYAQARYLGAKASVDETVKAWRDWGPEIMPLPHPSWRNNAWLMRNPWFEAELVPELRRRVGRALAGG